MEIRLRLSNQSLKRLLGGAIAIEMGLAVFFAVSRLPNMPLTIVELFDFDREVALPAWFSATQLSLIGLTFLLWSFWSESKARVSRRLLLLLGLGFVFLAADEASMIHERLTPLFKSVSWLPRFTGDRGLWIPLYLAAMLLFLFKFRRDFWRFWLAFPRQVQYCCLGGGIFLFGAVGLEVLNYQLVLEQLDSHWPVTFQILFEEFFEMSGASIILYGVLSMAWSALDVSQPETSEVSTFGTSGAEERLDSISTIQNPLEL